MDSRAPRPTAALSTRERAGAKARKSRARSPEASGVSERVRDAKRSVGSARDDENRFVHGDNLLVFPWLQRALGPVFRFAYVDPPFNTGRAFPEYRDGRSREEWIAFMRPRLGAIRDLLRPDGAVALEIDDTELGPLQVLCDDIFGPKNRVATITVVRSAGTGHKAQNRGPVNVSDFVLLYAKDKSTFRPTPLFVPRKDPDRAYSTFVRDPKAPLDQWSFVPLAEAAAEGSGYESARLARRAEGATFARRVSRFALEHADHVVRFAQVRVEAVSKRARELVARSTERPDEVFRLRREGRPDLLLRAGNRILFLSSKLRSLLPDGSIDPTGKAPRVLAEPLSNVWTDVPFQGIAREGSVVFVRNKKPERLVERLLAAQTSPGDWVLDPFVGSGTTAAVAETMGRRWVGIEEGEHLFTLAVPRLTRVVRGLDRTGIRRQRAHEGGGSFGVYR